MDFLIEVLRRPEFLISALVILVGAGVAVGVARRRPAMATPGMGRATRPPRAERPEVGFADIAGIDEAVTELQEIREYLVDPQRFVAVGANLPKGILLCGPPGTGKTMLARALAREAEVPFYAASAASFVEVFVGVGAARVRQLFAEARKHPPAIVFIDELDAIGRSRAAAPGGGHQEWESTLNQLLVEMDGFDPRSGVLVLAASNRPDVLDRALLRPGRFDRRIWLDLPDVAGREAILRAHAKTRPLASSVDLKSVARRTAGLSGADLANVVNEAAVLAARARSRLVEAPHFSEAVERVVVGSTRGSRALSSSDLERIAYHEAGHAVVAATLSSVVVEKISIVGRGRAGGFTLLAPPGDSSLLTRQQLLDQVVALLAGKTAEELALRQPSSGANDDVLRAVDVATRMVVDLGMSRRLGTVAAAVSGGRYEHGAPRAHHSERLAARVDEEIQGLLEEAEERASSILRRHREALDALAQTLLEAETLEGDALESILTPVRSGRESGVACAARQKTRSRAAGGCGNARAPARRAERHSPAAKRNPGRGELRTGPNAEARLASEIDARRRRLR